MKNDKNIRPRETESERLERLKSNAAQMELLRRICEEPHDNSKLKEGK